MIRCSVFGPIERPKNPLLSWTCPVDTIQYILSELGIFSVKLFFLFFKEPAVENGLSEQNFLSSGCVLAGLVPHTYVNHQLKNN